MVLVGKRMWWKRVGNCCIASYCSPCVLVLCAAPKRECILPQTETLQQESSKKSKTGINIRTESWQVVWQPWWGNFLLYLCRQCWKSENVVSTWVENRKKKKKEVEGNRAGFFYLALNVSKLSCYLGINQFKLCIWHCEKAMYFVLIGWQFSW